MTTQEFLDKLLSRAREAGFEDAQARFEENESFTVNVYMGEIEDYSVNKTRGVAFRAMLGGKIGTATTEALDEASIDLLINSARENALLIEDDAEQFIFAGSEKYETVDSYNKELDNVTATQKIELALALEKASLASDPRVEKVEDCSVGSEKSTEILANTRGLNLSHQKNMMYAMVTPIIKEGEEVGNEYVFKATRDFASLNADEIAREATQKTLRGMGGKPVPSGQMDVVIDAEEAGNLLRTFGGIFSADMAQKGQSLLRGKEGQTIAAPCVTLRDDPLKKDGLCSMPFDGEGVAVTVKNVIDAGKLTTLLHNLKTAKKDGVTTTGNAGNNPANIGATNFYIVPSQTSKEQLYAKVGEGLLITDLQGLHSGADAISGDFSLAAKGMRIENGVLTTPVAQITLAGNFFTLLTSVQEVGNDLTFGFPSSSHFGSPSLWVTGLTVAGE